MLRTVVTLAYPALLHKPSPSMALCFAPSLSSSSSSFSPTLSPPKLPKPPTRSQSTPANSSKLSPIRSPLEGSTCITRRDLSFLVPLGFFIPSMPASAFDIGISGPKDWLKEQKKKTSKFLLAPIDASREILRSAFLLLTAKDSGYESKDMAEIQNLVNSAARDCVPQGRSSFVAFQAKTGVEVCTFKLVVKNASSLLDDNDPVKLGAEAMLTELIRSFTSLNDAANEADIQLVSNRQGVANAIMDTISSLDKFEQGVKDILQV